ncbi:hypothetical protein GUITHDRAFT_103824 [Guillardia theta CCMP2712]|uniref:Uncharacterized protein n=2 Tax=Guillardia theta TaxID=55529 RepID=L1JQX9_GUITC|nr:hypothetical protein GUITHDRAFT_103824 [Guillardia theta CCMP2712]EKX50600.1 hypothetical protein GUITHDRAFT_103824 [Guillardia theta CCMP2712]|eukprot:XP_005837580.1 hypothetical protein GUITHDRAFT_103824 [Guillardia theta CCMP2712]
MCKLDGQPDCTDGNDAEPTAGRTRPSIADMYFFQELSQSNGQDDAVRWIASQTPVSLGVQSVLSRSTSPQNRSTSPQNRRPSVSISDDGSGKDEAKPSSDMIVEAESISQDLQNLHEEPHASKTLLSELGNNAGLLFTDAAHMCFER